VSADYTAAAEVAVERWVNTYVARGDPEPAALAQLDQRYSDQIVRVLLRDDEVAEEALDRLRVVRRRRAALREEAATP